MCGLAVILRIVEADRPADPTHLDAVLDAMDERLAHRGPDGAGRWRHGVVDRRGRRLEVAFVHRRLAVIDPRGGAQPMVDPPAGQGPDDELVAVVFNGCLFDHGARRTDLERAGARFRTDHSDTEVLLHGMRVWGDDLPDRVEGMFAAAFWDGPRRRLVLLRDRAGEKPIYWRELRRGGNGDRLILAASTLPALRAGRRRLDPAWTDDLDSTDGWAFALVHGFPDPGSTLGGGRSLPPSSRLVVELAPDAKPTPRVERWGTTGSRTSDDARPVDAEAALDLVGARLDAAVARRLEADVPLGSFLSGGLDSGLIASAATRHVDRLRTFCVRMPDPRYDESEAAAESAAHLGTDHATLDVDARPAADLVRLIGELGLPFGDSSLLPTHWVARAARGEVTAALSGDGGDELFVGYDRHVATRWLRRVGAVARWWPRATEDLAADPKTPWNRAARFAVAARHDGYADLLRLFPTPLARAVLEPAGVPESAWRRDPLRASPAREADPALAAADLDRDVYLPEDLLRKTDTASMSVALEVRCPWLDRDLFDVVPTWPADLRMPGGGRKSLLRRLAARRLPASVVHGPKRGFGIPIGEWFRTDHGGLGGLARDALLVPDPFPGLPLRRRDVEPIVEGHLSGHADHGQRLFALVALAVWARGADA